MNCKPPVFRRGQIPRILLGVLSLSLAACACKTEPPPPPSVIEHIQNHVACQTTRLGLIGGRALYRWPLEERLQLETERFEGDIEVHFEGWEEPVTERWVARVHRPEENWNGCILWYFHGTCAPGDFIHDRSGRENLSIYRSFEKGKPIVITITLGTFWFVDPQVRPQFWKIMEGVVRQTIPDSKTRRDCRHWAMGISLGGMNALQLAMHDHEGIRLDRVVVVAPYIPPCDPFSIAGCDCIEDPARNGNVNESATAMRLSLKGIRTQFSRSEWENCNPIRFAEDRGFPRPERVLLAWGGRDEFGFDQTSEALQKAAVFPTPPIVEPLTRHQMPQSDENLLKIATFLESDL